MSVQTQIDRINAAKADILAALTEKGVDTTGAGLADIAALVAGIEAGGGVVSGSFIATSTGIITIKHNLGRNPQGVLAIWDYATNGEPTDFSTSYIILCSFMSKTGTGLLTSGYVYRSGSSGSSYSASFKPSESFSGVPNGVDYTDALIEEAGSGGVTDYGAIKKVGETIFKVTIKDNAFPMPSWKKGISYKWVVW